MEEVLNQIQQLKEQLANLSIQTKSILDTEEAAQFLGLTKQYLYKMCQANSIPHFRSKGGKKIYFKRTDLEDWMLGDRVRTHKEIKEEALRRVVLS